MSKRDILNHHELSKLSDVPYTTIRGLYDKGYSNVKLQTILKLAKTLGCSLDYLADDETKEAPTNIDERSKAIDNLILKVEGLDSAQLSAVEQMVDLAASLRDNRKG